MGLFIKIIPCTFLFFIFLTFCSCFIKVTICFGKKKNNFIYICAFRTIDRFIVFIYKNYYAKHTPFYIYPSASY